MNEILFFIHILIVFACTLFALRQGKVALSCWVVLSAILANLLVLKQIYFFDLHITATDPLIIGSIVGLNLLREYHGKPAALAALWICFASMIFFVIASQVHLGYNPSPFDTAETAYQHILSPSPRLLIASLVTFLIVQRLDLYLFALFAKLPLVARNALSLIISQLLDTLLFSFLGLFGLVHSLTHVIIVSFAIKCLIIASSTPIIALSTRFTPKKT